MNRLVSTARVVCWLAAGLMIAATPLRAEDAAPKKRLPSNPIEAITNGLKLRADPVEPADFVKNSRPPEESLQYIPTGGRRAEPEGRVMSVDEIRAKEAELDSLRGRHDRVAHRKPVVGDFRSAGMEPKKKAPARVAKCLITCTVTPVGSKVR